MATRHAKLYQGEDLSPVIDYTDQVIWEESEFGTRAWQGEGSASTVVIRDPQGEQGNSADLPSGLTSRSLASKNLFVIDLDDDIIYRGRVGIKNYGRDGQQVERYRQVEVSLHDTHWDLDHIFVNAYSRASETGNARIQGIIASYLSGNPRPTTQLNGSNYLSGSNTIMLEAQTFNRTTPLQMIRDTATAENKQFFITGDTLGGGSIFYDGNDSTIYASDIRISDRIADQSVALTFPPIWNVGPASTEDGSQQLCEVVLFYGSADDQYVTAHNLTVHTQYGHSSETFTDDTIVDATAAQRRANAILAHRQYEDKTYNVTIGPLTDTEVLKVKHGQTINIKARAIPDADDQFRLMRIVQCRYTTPVIGVWFAHLQLGRPWKIEPYGTGTPTQPKAPAPGSSGSTFVDWTWSDGPLTGGFNNYRQLVSGALAADSSVVADFYMGNGTNNTEANFKSQSAGNDLPIDSSGSVQRYLPCTEGVAIPFECDIRVPSGNVTLKINWYTAAASFPLSTDTIWDAASPSWLHITETLTPPATAAKWTIFIDGLIDNVEASSGAVASVPAGLTADEIGTASGFYANADHNHDHNDLLNRSALTAHPASSLTEDNFGDVQTAITTLKDAEGIAIADAGGYFTATDVEGALQEVGADLAAGTGVTDHGALTGLADDDHPQYVRTTDGGKDTINVVAASGTATTLNLANGNHHKVTLTGNCTLTLSGATNGVRCMMTIRLIQDASGAHTVTWPASVEWVGGSAPTLQTAASAWDIVTLFTEDGGTTWFAQHAGTSGGGSGADQTVWVVDPGSASYSGTGPVTVALTSVFGINSSGSPYYNSANVTDGEEAALLWDSTTGTYFLRPYYP